MHLYLGEEKINGVSVVARRCNVQRRATPPIDATEDVSCGEIAEARVENPGCGVELGLAGAGFWRRGQSPPKDSQRHTARAAPNHRQVERRKATEHAREVDFLLDRRALFKKKARFVDIAV